MVTDASYPGERASPDDLNRLADFYRDAAFRASGAIQRGDPISAGPMRLLAIQSIELNLSAFLLLRGQSAVDIRRMGHDLAARLQCATQHGLALRQRTAKHIATLSRDREYLIARYGPECLTNLSQLNRMMATMEEVAGKVCAAIVKAREERAVSPSRIANLADHLPGAA